MARWIPVSLAAALSLGALSGTASQALAQAALADDIIAATAGGGGGGASPTTIPKQLQPRPASESGAFQLSPGGRGTLLGTREVPLPGPRRGFDVHHPLTEPDRPSLLEKERQQDLRLAGGLQVASPSLQAPVPIGNVEELAPLVIDASPQGLTLDEAINRLVHSNLQLQTKYYEIPIAEADILTASLRDNPLLFYSTSGVPYGDYSRERPGAVTHSGSIVWPIDYSDKRQARVRVAKQARQVIEAQFQDAVRQEINSLHAAWMEVLEARSALAFAEAAVARLDRLIELTRGDAGKKKADLDSLQIERNIARLMVQTEQSRLLQARQTLAGLLNLPAEEAHLLEIQGNLRADVPPLPPMEELIALALESRPDLQALRLGVTRARLDLELAQRNVFADAFVLWTPAAHIDRQYSGVEDSTAWSTGLFVRPPLFNRNQGNRQRAELGIRQSISELQTLERQVVTEVQNAVTALQRSETDLAMVAEQILPAVEDQRDEAYQKFLRGEIDADKYLQTLRDLASVVRHYRQTLVRHRRNMLHINTVVGCRLVP